CFLQVDDGGGERYQGLNFGKLLLFNIELPELMLEVGAEQNVIDLAFLAQGVEVEFLDPLHCVRVKLSEAVPAGRRTGDRIRTLQAAAIDDVVFDDGAHLARSHVIRGAAVGGGFVTVGRGSLFLGRTVKKESGQDDDSDNKCNCGQVAESHHF